MKYSVEKPGSPSELAHHGVKGQKWGVRKSSSSSSSSTRVDTAKKVGKTAAKGAGYAAILAGSAFVAVQLTKSGSTPVSRISNADIEAAGKAAQEAFKAAVKPEFRPK